MQLLKLLSVTISNMRQLLLLIFSLFLLGCYKEKEPSIVGTWELISAKTITKDSTFSSVRPNEKMIKIINNTHFSFLRHDLNKGKDSLATYVAGGGTYTFKNGKYTEYLEFLNYREWEGNEFHFNAKIANDTLTIEGIEKVEDLGVEHKIVEVYKKL